MKNGFWWCLLCKYRVVWNEQGYGFISYRKGLSSMGYSHKHHYLKVKYDFVAFYERREILEVSSSPPLLPYVGTLMEKGGGGEGVEL